MAQCGYRTNHQIKTERGSALVIPPHKTSRTGPATAVIDAVCTSNFRSFKVCPLERSLLAMEGDCPQLNSMPASLEEVRIDGLPSFAYYIADFISKEEEQVLLNKIETSPKPRWKQLSRRRLQTWPSDLHKDALLGSPLPKWLTEPIIPRLLSCPISVEGGHDHHIFGDSPHGQPNHVLINEYLPGQGIMPHKDGPAYYPVVCTVSLRASLCLDIYGSKEDGATEEDPRWRVLQEPRSLLITTGDLYTEYLHGIQEVKEYTNLGPSTICNWDLLRSPHNIIDGRLERHTRTSLTYRDVLKVSRLSAKLMGER